MKCSPSPKNCGQRWLPSPFVTGETGPPCADTRDKPPSGANTITSLGFHVAPPYVVTLLATICVSPLETRTFFSVLPTKKPIHWLSGDQNGVLAASVPGNRCSCSESRARSQSCLVPVASSPT